MRSMCKSFGPRKGVRMVGGGFCGMKVIPAYNEPVLDYTGEDGEKLKAAIQELRSTPRQIPVIINGVEYNDGKQQQRENPSHHREVIAYYRHASDANVLAALKSHDSEGVQAWANMSWHHRAAVFSKAADLVAGKYRYLVNASTIVGQGKNPYEAEIDAVAELCDFLRFNVQYAEEMYARQPRCPPGGSTWNFAEYRPLEGFTFAITPFNFTAIGGNLASCPALLGNAVLWKPSDPAVLSNYIVYKIFEEAGLPPGVINFVPMSAESSASVIKSPDMAAMAFTGSTGVFRNIWQQIGLNIEAYKTFPRVSGETGGKNFHLVHPTAHVPSVVSGTIRSAFDAQGQKCSACSRLYVPESLWPQVKEGLIDVASQIKVGPAEDFSANVGPVINEVAYDRIQSYRGKLTADDSVLFEHPSSKDEGWFQGPTVAQVKNPEHILMKEEIFGPFVSAYVYKDGPENQGWGKEVLPLVDNNKYGLTGAIYAQCRGAIEHASEELRHACGNLYINDKSTGSVVGMQPFGGSRGSGTNDKPGFPHFLNRFVTIRTVKETFSESHEVSHPPQAPLFAKPSAPKW